MKTITPRERQRFHHRHLPTLTRWSVLFFWKWAHLHFPIIVHARTDKYHKKLHHLIIDIVYAAMTFVFVAANIGLGVWFYLYFVPAHIEIHVSTPKTVTSGTRTALTVAYADPNKTIDDVDIGIYVPEGFLITDPEKQKGDDEAHFDVGALQHGQAGVVGVTGIVNGSVGDSYEVRVVSSYSYLNHRQYETVVHRFTVDETALDVSIDFPKAIVSNRVIPWKMMYNNTADVDYKQVMMTVQIPDGFTTTLSGALQQGVSYDSAKKMVIVDRIPAHSSGEIDLQSVFSGVAAVDASSDGQGASFELSVAVAAGIGAGVDPASTLVFSHGTVTLIARVIEPLVAVAVSADEHVDFGETIHARVTVQNSGTEEVTNVQLYGVLSGLPVSPSATTVTLEGTSNTVSGVNDDGRLVFPLLSSITPGAEVVYTVVIPTRAVSGERLSSVFTVSGEATVPSLDTVMPIIEQSVQTKYNSRVQLSSESLYYGPSSEQIGYGPYPPTAGEVTALRVILKVQNANNSLSNVRVQATLPSQVDWTNAYSVSTGTQMTWDEAARTITWTIANLSPATSTYGAQFEVRFHPNSLQVGLMPYLVSSQQINAYDTYTGQSVYQTASPVKIPVAIVQ